MRQIFLRTGAKNAKKQRNMNPKTHNPYRQVTDNRYSTAVTSGIQHKKTGKVSAMTQEKHMKWGKIARDFSVPVVGGTGVATYAYGRSNQKKKQAAAGDYVHKADGPIVEILKAVSKPESVEDKKDLPKNLRYRDNRFDDIEARRRVLPQLANVSEGVAAGSVAASLPGVAHTVSSRGSRGKVEAHSDKGAGPKGIGRHVGLRERSMVKPGEARKGQDKSKYRVVRRSERERRKERAEAVGTGVKTAVAAGGLLALKNKGVNDYLRESYHLGEKHVNGKFVRRARKIAKPVLRRVANKPGRYAALVGGVGATATGFKALREPDTHKIVFD